MEVERGISILSGLPRLPSILTRLPLVFQILEVKIGTIVAGVESSHKSWKPQSGKSKRGKPKSLKSKSGKSKSGKSKSGKSKSGKSKSGNPKSRKSDIEKQ